MKTFAPYVDSLLALAANAAEGITSERQERIDAALNGQPAEELRRVIPLGKRRENGVFFTGSVMARNACDRAMRGASDDAVFADPACGVGDLLVAVSHRLPVGKDLFDTLDRWAARLRGRDIYPEFVRATKARLVLAALARGVGIGTSSFPAIDSIFPHIKCGCGISDTTLFTNVTHIVLNPPYNKAEAPVECDWTSGNVSQAAIFIVTCLKNAEAGTRITAILPDVLRSGTRYAEWRSRIEATARHRHTGPLGRFDQWADVDVFMLDIFAGRTSVPVAWRWGQPADKPGHCVGDMFHVGVGTVVPHRHKPTGPLYPYVHAQGLPPWTVLRHVTECRRFQGRTFSPPFVLIRRTSRPGDRFRAVATVITGDNQVAVENHLIVLRPRDGKLKRCKELLTMLRSKATTTFLNKQIRCRHLTVGAVAALPWGERNE